MARSSWSLDNQNSMKKIYNGVVVPTISYGHKFWVEKINNKHIKARLLSVYGFCCRLITKAYRSVSEMIDIRDDSGIHPFNLEILKKNVG